MTNPQSPTSFRTNSTGTPATFVDTATTDSLTAITDTTANTLPVPVQPAFMAQAPATVKGAFTGTAPSTFNGDRAQSKQFMREFILFRALYDNHELILNPYKRVIVALSFFKGPKIEDWAADQLNNLNDKVTRANNPVGRDEEILWTEFKNAFTSAFTDTTQKQQAYCELHALRMQGSDLDSYISKFKHLAKKAGYDEAADATIDMFAKRLN